MHLFCFREINDLNVLGRASVWFDLNSNSSNKLMKLKNPFDGQENQNDL